MVPIKFIAMMPEMWRSAESRVENTMPENSSGKLSNAAVSSCPMGVEANPPERAASHPPASAANRKT